MGLGWFHGKHWLPIIPVVLSGSISVGKMLVVLFPASWQSFLLRGFRRFVAAGRGSDWLYAGWYLEMLHLTYPYGFPIAYADWDLPTDYILGATGDVHIPMPPPGLGKDRDKT